MPLEWAMTQMNLGVALGALAERRGEAVLFEEVGRRLSRKPRENGRASECRSNGRRAQNNLGGALWSLRAAAERNGAAGRGGCGLSRGSRGTNTGTSSARLGGHADESGSRAEDFRRARYRLRAVKRGGRRLPGSARGNRAQDRVPLRWATTQNNLASVLLALGERESGTGRLEEAVRPAELR